MLHKIFVIIAIVTVLLSPAPSPEKRITLYVVKRLDDNKYWVRISKKLEDGVIWTDNVGEAHMDKERQEGIEWASYLRMMKYNVVCVKLTLTVAKEEHE